jgi:hypothetical protein
LATGLAVCALLVAMIVTGLLIGLFALAFG